MNWSPRNPSEFSFCSFIHERISENGEIAANVKEMEEAKSTVASTQKTLRVIYFWLNAGVNVATLIFWGLQTNLNRAKIDVRSTCMTSIKLT
ncbi:hypothetical protein L596_008744 [Steinernema carpocapsae]|uniref:Uncharacterized protein n=1 Tax=Steinernema carpocapsae TaxID=34508 RepID=A0A4U5PDJ3_STECR|nr:hypothetical protein L596_008744 [Steinernema carpocapsae]